MQNGEIISSCISTDQPAWCENDCGKASAHLDKLCESSDDSNSVSSLLGVTSQKQTQTHSTSVIDIYDTDVLEENHIDDIRGNVSFANLKNTKAPNNCVPDSEEDETKLHLQGFVSLRRGATARQNQPVSYLPPRNVSFTKISMLNEPKHHTRKALASKSLTFIAPEQLSPTPSNKNVHMLQRQATNIIPLKFNGTSNPIKTDIISRKFPAPSLALRRSQRQLGPPNHRRRIQPGRNVGRPATVGAPLWVGYQHCFVLFIPMLNCCHGFVLVYLITQKFN